MMNLIVVLAAATLPAWNHGAADCSSNKDPAIQVVQFDADTYVLRQNKCVHFEAPFIYVLFGDHTVFVQDTGATAEPAQFPLYDVVQSLVTQRTRRPGAEPLRLLVTHSHSHGDHTAGDGSSSCQRQVTRTKASSFTTRGPGGFSRATLSIRACST